MKTRILAVLILTCLFFGAICLLPPEALAVVQIKLSDVSYKDCPPELAEGNVTSGGNTLPATCFIIKKKKKNPSGKTVYDADVFGRINDANGEPVLQNRSRVGSIAEIPPGVSKFEIRISVPTSQPTPLQLEQFKAAGFTGTVSPKI